MQLLKLAALCCLRLVLGESRETGNDTRVLSRHKRYVAFPEGSSVSAAICLTIGVVGNPHVDYLSWAVNWGVAYDLPNYAWARKHANGFLNDTKAAIQRRSRRDLYEKLELALDNMGFHGSACIARALCESTHFIKGLRNRKGNMVEELVKSVFSFPSSQIGHDEPHVHHHYGRVCSKPTRSASDCSKEYADCQFSLLELALGKYSSPITSGKGAANIFFM